MAFGVGRNIGSAWLVPTLMAPGQNLWTPDVASVVWNDWFFGTTAAPPTGRTKVWDGSAWTLKPVKVWNGSAWVEKPLKVWDGGAWV